MMAGPHANPQLRQDCRSGNIQHKRELGVYGVYQCRGLLFAIHSIVTVLVQPLYTANECRHRTFFLIYRAGRRQSLRL
jgi:hypothetical protein